MPQTADPWGVACPFCGAAPWRFCRSAQTGVRKMSFCDARRLAAGTTARLSEWSKQ